MPNRIPTPGIPTPAVRKSSTAQKAAAYLDNVGKTFRSMEDQKNAPARNPKVGQFYGALLQGRRYDSKGNQK
jgi:hypothetical protein